MLLAQLDQITIAVVILAFLLAGVSKGFIGFGLPLISIPIAATVVPVPLAIALTAAPILVSNLFQTFHGGRHGAALRRFWPVVVMMVVGVLIGGQVLTRADQDTIAVIVGALLLIFVSTQFFDLRPAIPLSAERRLNPVIGLVSGLLGGVSSMFGPLAITYLVALRLPKDEFIATIAMFYLVGITTLWSVLIVGRVISSEEIVASFLACVPLYAGMWFGTWLRGKISQVFFQRALLVALILISLNLIRKGLF